MERSNQAPAFPLFVCPGDVMNAAGLTKRELFAALAMQGFCTTGAGFAERAEWAVQQAHALLAELAKPAP